MDGITGTISFDDTGDPVKKVVIMEISNGKPLFHSIFNLEKKVKRIQPIQNRNGVTD